MLHGSVLPSCEVGTEYFGICLSRVRHVDGHLWFGCLSDACPELCVHSTKTTIGILMHVLEARNTNVSRGAGLVPNGVRIGTYSRLPMTILEGSGVKGHQGPKHDQLGYCASKLRVPGKLKSMFHESAPINAL